MNVIHSYGKRETLLMHFVTKNPQNVKMILIYFKKLVTSFVKKFVICNEITHLHISILSILY